MLTGSCVCVFVRSVFLLSFISDIFRGDLYAAMKSGRMEFVAVAFNGN